MDRVRLFLDDIRERGLARGNFLGLLNVLIGRRVALEDGTPVSAGLTYRELAALLKRVRWEREAAAEVGLDPATLPPRDRERYWYQVIVQARVDSDKAAAAGERLAEQLRGAGYAVAGAGHRRLVGSAR
jgi:hypothetical protein